jgi:hypothetical protein
MQSKVGLSFLIRFESAAERSHAFQRRLSASAALSNDGLERPVYVFGVSPQRLIARGVQGHSERLNIV